MANNHGVLIASELGLKLQQVKAVEALLEQGATIPFIARYRKETTGSLDEVLLAKIRDKLARPAALDDRRQAILTEFYNHKFRL